MHVNEEFEEEVEVIKQTSIDLFQKGGINLHKWQPNIPSLQPSIIKSESKLTYVKEKFKNTADLTKILGVPWDKIRDNLSVCVMIMIMMMMMMMMSF